MATKKKSTQKGKAEEGKPGDIHTPIIFMTAYSGKIAMLFRFRLFKTYYALMLLKPKNWNLN